jgi:hypothetical protein
MVQASTLVIAAFAIAPVLAAPLAVPQTDETFTRAVDTDYLEVRAPFFRKIGRFLKRHAAPMLRTAAGLVFRDVDGSLYVRDVDVDLTERDLADLKARGFSELSERELADLDLEDLEARRFNLRGAVGRVRGLARKAGGIVGTATRVAGRVSDVASSLGFREFEDSEELDARDYLDIDELLAREYGLDLEELEARRFNLRAAAGRVRGLARKAGGIVGTATRVAGRVSDVASSLGFREFEDEEFEARSTIDDLD